MYKINYLIQSSISKQLKMQKIVNIKINVQCITVELN